MSTKPIGFMLVPNIPTIEEFNDKSIIANRDTWYIHPLGSDLKDAVKYAQSTSDDVVNGSGIFAVVEIGHVQEDGTWVRTLKEKVNGE